RESRGKKNWIPVSTGMTHNEADQSTEEQELHHEAREGFTRIFSELRGLRDLRGDLRAGDWRVVQELQMSLQLTIAFRDYDRTHPLIDGSIKPEGIELNWLVLPHLEIWTRMLNYYDFDVSEISLSSYLIARTIGKPLTAIPVFPARAFRHSYVFINTKSGMR